MHFARKSCHLDAFCTKKPAFCCISREKASLTHFARKTYHFDAFRGKKCLTHFARKNCQNHTFWKKKLPKWAILGEKLLTKYKNCWMPSQKASQKTVTIESASKFYGLSPGGVLDCVDFLIFLRFSWSSWEFLVPRTKLAKYRATGRPRRRQL